MAHRADDAAALARHVAGADPVVVIGHSFGGFIAQAMAIRQGHVSMDRRTRHVLRHDHDWLRAHDIE